MSDRSRACFSATIHFLQILQSCCLHTVRDWSSEHLRDTLSYGVQFQIAIERLTPGELKALQHFIEGLQPRFMHLNLKGLTSAGLDSSLAFLVKLLCRNPYLSKTHRDLIFEFCLDKEMEIPHFEEVPDEALSISPATLSAIECRLFIEHLVILQSTESKHFELFLDSCFDLDARYVFGLIIRVLEQLSSHQTSDGFVMTRLIGWMREAISNDNVARVSFSVQDPLRLRDLALSVPKFADVILMLFDPVKHLQPVDNVPTPSDLSFLVRCLIRADHFFDNLPRLISNLGKVRHTRSSFWTAVSSRIQEELQFS